MEKRCSNEIFLQNFQEDKVIKIKHPKSLLKTFFKVKIYFRIYLKRKRPRLESGEAKVDPDAEPSAKQSKGKLEEGPSKSGDQETGIKTLKSTKEKDTKSPKSPPPDQKAIKSGNLAESEKTDTKDTTVLKLESPKSGNGSNSESKGSTLSNLKVDNKDVLSNSPHRSTTPISEDKDANVSSKFESKSDKPPPGSKKSNSSGGQILSVANNLAKKQLDLVEEYSQTRTYSSNSPPPMAVFSAALQLQYAVKPPPVTTALSSPSNGTPVMVSPTLKSSSPKSLLSNVTVLSPTEKSKQTLNELRKFRKTTSDSPPTKSSPTATQLNLSATSKSLPSSLIAKLFENTASSSHKLVSKSDSGPPSSLPTPKSPVSDEKKVKAASPTSSTSMSSNKQQAQLPSNRLQLKVQQSTPVSTFQTALQSSIYNHLAGETLWKQQHAAVMKALEATGSFSKTLNQGVRQIPNPSLLAKQQKDLIVAIAATAVNHKAGDPNQSTER